MTAPIFSNDVDLIEVQVPGATEIITIAVPGAQGPQGLKGDKGDTGAAAPDATPTVKGLIQLAGDLGGTAAAPTVSGTSAATGNALVRRDVNGDASFRTVMISNVGAATHATNKSYVDTEIATRAAASHTHTAANISDSTTVGRAVLTAADATAARTAIGAGTSSLVIGTTGTTAMAGNKTFTAAEVGAAPASHTHTAANISDSTATGRSVLTAIDAPAARTAIGAGTSSLVIGTTSTTAKAGDYSPPVDAAAGVASMRTLGTGATQAAAGNDSRLSDARTPTAHTHTASQISDSTTVGRSILTAADAAAARAASGATASAAIGTASQIVETSKVTGDTTNRFERRSDGSITIGPGGTTALKDTEAFVAIDTGAETTRHGLTIYTSSDAGNTSQALVIYDYLGAPIFSVPKAGGPAVYGDHFRVFNGGDIFNHESSLRMDGTLQARKGDPAGGSGVFALGAATTAPTRNPDGSVALQGATTVAGAVIWADANGRLRSRRASGPIDIIGGAPQQATAPTVGVQPGDIYHSSTDKRLRAYDGNAWNRVGMDFSASASIQPVVGEWLTSPYNSNGGGVAPTASQMLLTPIDILEDGMVFNLVGVKVVGAGVGGTPKCRFGLYADSGNGSRPTGAPLQDWGLVTNAQTTANTDSTLAISWTPPRLGRYWLAIVYQPVGTVTTVPTYQIIYGVQALPSTSLDLSFGPGRAWTMNGVTGALPTISGLGLYGNGYSMGLKRSA